MTTQAAKKTTPTLSIEKQYSKSVCGIDEAGRGPLAGPVLAACVYIPEKHYNKRFIAEINDSKKLSMKKRENLFLQIQKHCGFGIGIAKAEEIDTLNIHNATLLAMRRAYQEMCNDFTIKPAISLIDGLYAPDINCECETIKRGDSISCSIAAASILAKVTRDRIMLRLHNQYPHYGWERNAGYGTAEHIAAINEHGITEYHRRSFSPIKQYKS